jgi:hypothetical protein
MTRRYRMEGVYRVILRPGGTQKELEHLGLEIMGRCKHGRGNTRPNFTVLGTDKMISKGITIGLIIKNGPSCE